MRTIQLLLYRIWNYSLLWYYIFPPSKGICVNPDKWLAFKLQFTIHNLAINIFCFTKCSLVPWIPINNEWIWITTLSYLTFLLPKVLLECIHNVIHVTGSQACQSCHGVNHSAPLLPWQQRASISSCLTSLLITLNVVNLMKAIGCHLFLCWWSSLP